MRIRLDLPLSACELCEAVGAAKDALEDKLITHIVTDSREARTGDLFLPLASEPSQRKMHAKAARQSGATVMGESDINPDITVSDTRGALLKIAALYKSRLPRLMHTVGVTGSTGKTTVTRFISRILSKKYAVHSTIENFNNVIGLSLSVLTAMRDCEVLVLEMGMNHRGEISLLADAIRPDICVITSIGTAHIGNLGSREEIALAKLEILTPDCTHLLCPLNEPLLFHAPSRITFSASVPADYTLTGNGRLITPTYTKDGIKLNIHGEHLLADACVAAAVASILGISGEDIVGALGELSDGDGRARILKRDGLTVIDDTYNSSYEAAVAMLDYLKDFPAPRAAVLGDMLELGKESEELHFLLGKRSAEAGIDLLVAVGKYANHIASGARSVLPRPSRISVYDTPESSGDIAREVLSVGRGTVLVKGSHATGLKKITDAIMSKEINDG